MTTKKAAPAQATATPDKYGNTRISLRKIKYAAFASEETACFEAELLLDGKPIADASNDGHGGCNKIRAYGAEKRALLDEAEAYAKTLPILKSDSDDGMDLELLVSMLVGDELDARDKKKFENKLKKLCQTKIVFRTPGDPEDEWRTVTRTWSPSLKEPFLKQFPGATILNETYCAPMG